jgi:hypothetical protein
MVGPKSQIKTHKLLIEDTRKIRLACVIISCNPLVHNFL